MNIVGKWNRNQYHIIGIVGKGNFGTVYKAYNDQGQVVAIKISKELLSLTNEYNGLKRFHHLNFVPRVYDLDDWEGKGGTLHFLVMEYIQGLNLKDIIRKKSLTKRQAFKIGLRLTGILKEIYNLGYKYTDIKLENIILDNLGNIYLIDYGSLIEKDKPTKEYTQTYNPNSWNLNRKYGLEETIVFSISMIMANLIGKKEYNPIKWRLNDLISEIYKLSLVKKEKKILIQGLRGRFKSLDKYYLALSKVTQGRKYYRKFDKIDYLLLLSIVSFVFIFLWSLKIILNTY